MNKIFLIGNLTRDPELRATQSGVPVCTFTVAVNRRKQGAEAGQQEADFFRVTTWRQQAENCNRYLAKGRKVGVVGNLTMETYTDKPLGRLANAELREWKKKAHAAFDPLWQGGKMRRNQAYAWLAQRLGLPTHLTHIGMFDVITCQQVVRICTNERS